MEPRPVACSGPTLALSALPARAPASASPAPRVHPVPAVGPVKPHRSSRASVTARPERLRARALDRMVLSRGRSSPVLLQDVQLKPPSVRHPRQNVDHGAARNQSCTTPFLGARGRAEERARVRDTDGRPVVCERAPLWHFAGQQESTLQREHPADDHPPVHCALLLALLESGAGLRSRLRGRYSMKNRLVQAQASQTQTLDVQLHEPVRAADEQRALPRAGAQLSRPHHGRRQRERADEVAPLRPSIRSTQSGRVTTNTPTVIASPSIGTHRLVEAEAGPLAAAARVQQPVQVPLAKLGAVDEARLVLGLRLRQPTQ